MAVPEPEETDRRGQPDVPDDTDRAFAEIVAGWRAESTVPRWPADPGPADPELDGGIAPDEPEEPEEEHYRPPEPPPFPVLRPRTLGGLAVLAMGMVLLIAPGLPGLTATTATVLGVLALAGSVAWLLMGLGEGPAQDSGWDDGARL